MLLDEPFGALDPLTRDSLQAEYRRIHGRLELTTVMVTHDMTEALLMADRIAVMNKGKIVQVGSPQEMVSHPQDDYVKELMSLPTQQAERLKKLTRSHDGG